MPVTQIFTNLPEYSRYHRGTTSDRPDLSVIVATVEVLNPTPGDTMSVALWRLDGYGAVCTKQVTLTSATAYTVQFDLNVDGYVATSPLFQNIAGLPVGNGVDNIYRAKQGDYVIQVTDSSEDVTVCPQFAVSIVPVWELKNEWCKGVTFWDYEVLEPRMQPQLITGVTVVETSENHPKGPMSLVFTPGVAPTLSWAGGPAIPVNGLQPVQVLLTTPQDDFIMLQVVPSALPIAATDETLYIDNGRMKDTAMIDQLRRSTGQIQEKIICKIEPSIVDTDPSISGLYCDEVAIPETYYRPRTYDKWMNFQIPYPRILWPGDLSVTGYFGFTQTATVPRNWLSWSEVTGIVELVPSSSSTVIWSFYNSIFVMAYLFNFASIPSFWHYRCTVGLRDLWNDRAIVREAIAKKAAIELLNTAGSSWRAGYSSQSSGRDGVSQSQSFTASASYGLYGGHYTSYVQWLDKELPRMKTRFGGISYTTI